LDFPRSVFTPEKALFPAPGSGAKRVLSSPTPHPCLENHVLNERPTYSFERTFPKSDQILPTVSSAFFPAGAAALFVFFFSTSRYYILIIRKNQFSVQKAKFSQKSAKAEGYNAQKRPL
jgi:hypothetical protein